MPTTTVSTSPFVLAAGQSLSVTDADGLLLQAVNFSQAPDITLDGQLQVSATAAGPSRFGTFLSGVRIGDSAFYTGRITIDAGGSISIDATSGHINAAGILGVSFTPHIFNYGAIEVAGAGDAYGVYSGGSEALGDTGVTNAGLVHVTSNGGTAYGVYLPTGEGFANGGTIEVSGAHASYGVYMFQWDSAFLNSGTIRVTDSAPGEDSVAAYLNTTVARGFLNAGTLQGDYALKFNDYNPELPGFPVSVSRFENTGRMIGKVDLGHANQVLVNSGSIQGDVALGTGDDTYSGRAGSIVGMVSGGEGNDSLQGGAGFDYLQGNAGNDTVVGGGGADWLLGGQGADLINGGADANVLYGNLGDDWLDGGGGADLIRGGQGADVLLGQDGDDWLSGDKGDDTLAGGAGADIFHSFQDAGLDRVTDFNAAEGDRVQLDPGTTYTLRQVGADTVVDMGAGGQLVLVGVQLSSLPVGWIFGS
jgi:Ca2+-binding RTX toxin-like protein